MGWALLLLVSPLKLSPVLTGHGVVYTRQSMDASGRISWSMWLARAVCTWIWCIISLWPSYLAVIVAVFGCCLWCTIGFPWRCYGRNSWFDSGYMFCVSFERFCDEFHIFSTLRRTPILQYLLSPFSRRTEKCALLTPQFTVFFALLTQRNLDIISMTIHGWQWV